MKTVSCQVDGHKFSELLDAISGSKPDILFVFGNSKAFTKSASWDMLADLRNVSGCKHLIGCSTAGEIGDRVLDDSVSVLGLSFEKTKIRTAHIPLPDIESSFASGRMIAEELFAKDLAAIFILGPGVAINGNMVVKGMRDVLPAHIPVSGGLAGDGTAFQKTTTFLDADVFDNELVAVGFYGDSISVSTAAVGGWKPFGPHRRVTKSEGSTLYALDDAPALELYRQYLGEKAANLPSSGLLYPFSIINDQDNQSSGLIRTILNIDNDKNSLIFAGDIAQGELVTLAHANTDNLAEGAEQAARKVFGDSDAGAGAALCVSCVGRKILMGQDAEEELEAVQKVMGNVPIAGFYSYGEICHFEPTGRIELHNQTMTITHFKEA